MVCEECRREKAHCGARHSSTLLSLFLARDQLAFVTDQQEIPPPFSLPACLLASLPVLRVANAKKMRLLTNRQTSVVGT